MSPWLPDTLLRTQTDERLVALAREGHERAFVAIIERYRRPLLAFARRLVPEPRAEDVVQQSFLAAWKALGAGAEVRHLRGWLHRIVRNAAGQALAAGPLEEQLSDGLAAPGGVEAEAERRARLRDTLAGVAALPERQRSALVQTAVEGRSRVEVAASLGLSEGAVRQLVHRARATLRAAATAVTPTPLAQWAAQGGPGRPATGAAERLAELAAGAAGSASAAGVAIKASAVIAVTGAVASGVGGGVREHHGTPGGPESRGGVAIASGAAATSGAAGPGPAVIRRTVDARPTGAPGEAGRVVRGSVRGGAGGPSLVASGGGPRHGADDAHPRHIGEDRGGFGGRHDGRGGRERGERPDIERPATGGRGGGAGSGGTGPGTGHGAPAGGEGSGGGDGSGGESHGGGTGAAGESDGAGSDTGESTAAEHPDPAVEPAHDAEQAPAATRD